MNFPKQSQNFSHIDQMVRNHIAEKHYSFYQSAIHMKVWERQCTNFTSNAKYGDTLHPNASKQFMHFPNYILSHTNRCVTWMNY